MAHEKLYINRELRWLSFNERVLMNAENPATPLMERLKFVGIFSSNLDEFYAVRVGSLHRSILDPRNHPCAPGVNPKSLLKQILNEVKRMNARMDVVMAELMKELKRHHICILNEETINSVQLEYIDTFFSTKLRNWLFLIMLDANLPFPYLKHVTLYLAIHMYNSTNKKDFRYALIEVPTDVLARYISIPSKGNWNYFIALEDIIRLKLTEIFRAFPYDRYDAYTIKITRDGEYDLADEVTKSLYEKLSTSIKQRSEGDPVRFVYDREIPKMMLSYIMEKAHLENCRIILPGGRYHNARDMLSFPHVGKESLYYEAQPPLNHHTLSSNGSLFSQIEAKDHLISLPYHRYASIIDLLREAALDSSVVSIKMTLYRVPENSSVINALRNAARNGKKVTLFIELQARFDEKINIHWTEKLTRERNITLISGVEGMKVHSKICIITRKVGKKTTQVSMIGTGNFNEITASLYSDHVLLTAHPKLNQEIDLMFDLLDRGFADIKFKHLVVSPFHTRKRFMLLIKNEMEFAKKGKQAQIVLKLNNLVDPQMIKQLVKAAKAGVSVILMIRGICSLSIKSEQNQIQGKALIDRYLEHTRIIKFNHGGDPLYFIGSADWMERNLDNRIEVMVPIYSKEIQEELSFFLDAHWKDTYSSFALDSQHFNQKLQTGEEGEARAQKDIYQWYEKQLEIKESP